MFSVFLYFQESNYIFICEMWLFDLFFSSILQIWYVEIRISRSISESPLDFEITKVDCIFLCLCKQFRNSSDAVMCNTCSRDHCLPLIRNFKIQSTLVISNSKGLSEILRDIRTSTYQICRIEEKIIRITTFNKYICNWTHEVRDILKILRKRGEIAP